MIVVDASALAVALLTEAGADAVAHRLFADDADLHAPHLIDLEIASILRKLTTRGLVDPNRAQLALEDFQHLELTRYPHALLLPRVWSLRANLTPYDAAYIALAELLDTPLVTRDQRLAQAPGHHVKVEVL